VLRFHGRLFQPAQLAGVSVQAIALRYDGEGARFAPFIGEDEFLPHLLDIIKLESIELSLHYCPTLPAGLDRSEMAAASHAQIAEALDPAWAHGRSRGQRRIMRY
jgi:1-acyl-sn-glycerol-3-phosphate acyltransferase